MTTEAQQKDSGSLSTERVQSRLRPAPAPEASVPPRVGQAPAAHMRRMAPAEFNTAMIHFYRGEVQRSNTWRNRWSGGTCRNDQVPTAFAAMS